MISDDISQDVFYFSFPICTHMFEGEADGLIIMLFKYLKKRWFTYNTLKLSWSTTDKHIRLIYVQDNYYNAFRLQEIHNRTAALHQGPVCVLLKHRFFAPRCMFIISIACHVIN